MGLINQQMDPAAEAPAPEQAAPTSDPRKKVMLGEELEEGPEGEEGPEPDESDPAYQAALEMMNKVMYEQGAAKDMANQMIHSPDTAEAMANIAYEVVTAIGERMEGALADELVVSLAFEVLTNVAEIAEAAGAKVDGPLVSKAVKIMLQRYAAETGMDDGTLQNALAQADDQQIGMELESQAQQEPVQ